MGSMRTNYDKLVIFLHGEGRNRDADISLLQRGYFGGREDLENIKFVFPNSFRNGSVWFDTYKNECTWNQTCAYNVTQVVESG